VLLHDIGRQRKQTRVTRKVARSGVLSSFSSHEAPGGAYPPGACGGAMAADG
jgi:hypothetical protein